MTPWMVISYSQVDNLNNVLKLFYVTRIEYQVVINNTGIYNENLWKNNDTLNLVLDTKKLFN